MSRRRLVRVARGLLVALLAAVVGVGFFPAAAWAHVSVDPDTAEPGGFAMLSFRVPNERADASTVKLELALPQDEPLEHVSVEPVPGWTVTTATRKLDSPISTEEGEITEAVSSVAWEGGSIRPGQLQRFAVSVGPLPEGTDTLVFKAIQTYSSGEVVRWIEVPEEGAAEPEHPAPVVTLRPADSGSAPETAANGAASEVDTYDTGARLVGAAALVAAVAALAVAVLGRRRKAGGAATSEAVDPVEPPVEARR